MCVFNTSNEYQVAVVLYSFQASTCSIIILCVFLMPLQYSSG